ncbi:MAG: hypothetical protein OEY24_04565 [Candidatus Bathyarchaeota archaeon]|nr:hypothetical protein [Candidatus Bathyarchaeota archaeon]
MRNMLGELKNIFYFDVCGQINTEKTLELAIQRARELNLNKLIVASETGISALKAVDMLRNSGISLIVVTSAAGAKIENTVVEALKNRHSRQEDMESGRKKGARIVRATDPL